MKSKVFKTAWQLVKESAISFAKALKMAWKLVKNEKFEIEFVKKSTGEITKRVASFAKIKEQHLLFWSETDNGYRMALLENIINIKKI
ncbi:hypothetical protein [Raineya sp.]